MFSEGRKTEVWKRGLEEGEKDIINPPKVNYE